MHAGVVVMLCGLLFTQAGAAQPAPDPSTGRVAGAVTDSSGMPIAGARIMLFPSRPPRSGPIVQGGMWRPLQAETDAAGHFVLANVAPGSYHLDVQKTGFAPVGEPGRPLLAEVSAGKTVTLALSLRKGGAITGKVLDARGEPLPDVRMMAMRRAERPANLPPQYASSLLLVPAPGNGMQQTNDLGEFRIAGLAPGEYYVAAMPGGMMLGGPGVTPVATGTAKVATYYPGTSDERAAQPITVTAGDTVYNIEFTMQSAPGYRVSGIIVDENGAAVAGAMVMLMPSRPRGAMFPPGNATTGEDGRFSFTDVPSATYHINASIPVRITQAGGRGAGGGAVVGSGAVMSWSSTFGPGGTTARRQMPEVTVNDADVAGVRVEVRRPPQ